ncbi:DNA mismatch repair protein MutL [Xylona heveae TC161]|uniref:DNA mismatch repair protein PMS1 n=1 Tax=Xylona heveae (strain CBS 132557 / TC161) TaxID=1328760 RepID=A0A165HFE5_XYLHT|nr:DNA mismatch repair protein MutL [Xylona heveae TC161]KZF23429.1 DNA mismatch repair protein MutL [Xylona heveae TC161]
MATIKAIEGRSVHQIQSGQVIVDLCSVVKELVENSLDAGATSIEVRFKNNGLESIEVQDNGQGIAPENFETVALKHHTSKLSTYDDLETLQTFGFRGEALSSLCALSEFHVITARAQDAPKASRLDFEVSGKLKHTSIVAGQKGTLVVVGNLFHNLPVRRRELEKTIKREYGKVLGLLHAYACISVNVKFTVSNQMAKGRKAIVFSTKSNPSTRENIANVFGAKTLTALVPLNLTLEMQPTNRPSQKWTARKGKRIEEVLVSGHVSRPVFGEGRQTPDRQMFFVNSRPCGLPQIAKVFNEVYKTFNVTQSPFVFADFRMDTSAYDVNVSPDKRTILLHDQNALLETLKESLTQLFESTDQTVPQSQPILPKGPLRKELPARRNATPGSDFADSDETMTLDQRENITDNAKHDSVTLDSPIHGDAPAMKAKAANAENNGHSIGPFSETLSQSLSQRFAKDAPGIKPVLERNPDKATERDSQIEQFSEETTGPSGTVSKRISDFNKRMADQDDMRDSVPSTAVPSEDPIPALTPPPRPRPGIIENAFDRMRPKRMKPEMATITIGSKTTTSPIGTSARRTPAVEAPHDSRLKNSKNTPPRGSSFAKNLQAFAASDTRQELSSDAERSGGSSSSSSSSSSSAENSENEEGPQESIASDSKNKDSKGQGYTSDAEVPDENMIDGDAGDAEEVPEALDSDSDYVDEEEAKAQEQARVQALIREAEDAAQVAARPTEDNIKRANHLLRNSRRKDSTTQLLQRVDWSIGKMEHHISAFRESLEAIDERRQGYMAKSGAQVDRESAESVEERLSLTISKEDFAQMRVVGQFNLGFILAARPYSVSCNEQGDSKAQDELFIIDQHASDEKYNFERLQAETVVQNQRLVKPRALNLTAVEEEILLENTHVLEKNGFIVEVDASGEEPIGQRCKLVSLPISRDVVFDTRDLEELISLLADSPSSASHIPRPSKVRRMFAMRACRSSIMVGHPLTAKRMKNVLVHMGEIDKPWNCPHGRPTMRHLVSLDALQPWQEGQGLVGLGDEGTGDINWRDYLG